MISMSNKFAFLAFFALGVLFIFTFRIIADFGGISEGAKTTLDVVAIVSAAAIITCYAVLGHRDAKREDIIDRISDNTYYLGLLFTLSSLCYSLIKISFSGQDGEFIRSLLTDFGLGLISTIVGIAGRILLQQTKPVYDDGPDSVAGNFSLAAYDLKDSIGKIVSDLDTLSKHTIITMERVGEAAVEAVEKISIGAKGINEKFEGLILELGKTTTKVKQSLEQQNANAYDMIESTKEFQKKLTEIQGAITTKNYDEISDLISQMESSVRRFNETIGDTDEKLKGSLEGIEKHKESLDDSTKKVETSSATYIEKLGKAAKILRKVTDKIK